MAIAVTSWGAWGTKLELHEDGDPLRWTLSPIGLRALEFNFVTSSGYFVMLVDGDAGAFGVDMVAESSSLPLVVSAFSHRVNFEKWQLTYCLKAIGTENPESVAKTEAITSLVEHFFEEGQRESIFEKYVKPAPAQVDGDAGNPDCDLDPELDDLVDELCHNNLPNWTDLKMQAEQANQTNILVM